MKLIGVFSVLTPSSFTNFSEQHAPSILRAITETKAECGFEKLTSQCYIAESQPHTQRCGILRHYICKLQQNVYKYSPYDRAKSAYLLQLGHNGMI